MDKELNIECGNLTPRRTMKYQLIYADPPWTYPRHGLVNGEPFTSIR